MNVTIDTIMDMAKDIELYMIRIPKNRTIITKFKYKVKLF